MRVFTEKVDATGTILQRLDNILGINEKGEVTLGFGTEFNTCVDVLRRCLVFSRDVSEAQQRAIVRRAVIEAKKGGNFSTKAITDKIEAEQRSYLRNPIRRFVLLTSASFRLDETLRPIRLKDNTLTFMRHRPENYPLPDGGSFRVTDNTPHDYFYIKVHISARDPHGAAELGFQTADFWRAIWNFFYNLGSDFRITFGSEGHKPVNRILPGPIHTLHYPNGSLALEGQWWYTPLVKGVHAEQISRRYNALRHFERLVRRKIASCNFSDQLVWFLIRYVRALDEPDLTTSFLRLWALLEEITTGTTKSSSDVTIKRTSFVFDDPQYAKILLDFLRDQRNRIVHKGSQPDDGERLTYELKRFVEAILKFLLVQSTEFENLQAFHSLLDLPPNPKLLRERIRQHEMAYKLRHR